MSYVTYTTEALVCGGADRGSYDRSIMLFTREAGLLFAIARGVRKEASRQRYALTDFSQIRVSLIRGKQGWIIGSVEPVRNDFALAQSRGDRASVVKLYRLVRRFVHGEEPAPALYDCLVAALAHAPTLGDNHELFDEVIMVRCLHHLGYVAQDENPKEISGDSFSFLEQSIPSSIYATLKRLITRTTDTSHL